MRVISCPSGSSRVRVTSTETTCCPERLNRVSSQEGKPVLGASMRQTSTGLFKSIFKGKCLLCSVHFCYLIFLVAGGIASAEARRGAFQLWGIVASISRSQINTRKKYAEVTNSITRKGQGRGLRPVSFSLAESRGRASGASPHSIYTMISERTDAVNSRRRTTRTPSSRTRPKRMTVPSTVYSTTPY